MDDAYAAGLIDGEGCFYIDPSGLTPRLEVGMAEGGLVALEWLEGTYGGTVRQFRSETERWQASYRWYLIGKAAVAVTRRLLPHLRVKRPHAEQILCLTALREQMPLNRFKRPGWTPELRAQAEDVRAALSALNRPKRAA